MSLRSNYMTKVIESLLSRPNRCISPRLHCKNVCLQPRLCVRSHCRPQLRANARTDVNQIGATRIIRTRTKAARAKASSLDSSLCECGTVPGAPCKDAGPTVPAGRPRWSPVAAEALTSATSAFKAANNGVSHVPQCGSESD